MQGRIYLANVESVYDDGSGGVINISVTLDGGKTIYVDARYAAPIAGFGHGIFAIPEIGTTVLVANTHTTPSDIVLLTTGGLGPYDYANETGWIWFACINENRIMPSYRRKSPRNLDDFEYALSHGTPDIEKAYGATKGYPCQYIWMSPKGHKLVLSDRTGEDAEEEGTSDNSISLHSANGKKVLLDETNRPAGGDMILIEDDSKFPNKNRIRVQTGTDEQHSSPIGSESIEVFANNNILMHNDSGAITITIGKESHSDLVLDNQGLGDIRIKANGGSVHIESTGVGTTVTTVAKNPMTLMESSVTVSPESVLLHSMAPINISSETMVNIQAPLVNIDQIVTNRPGPSEEF